MSTTPHLSAEERSRYARHLSLPEFGDRAQIALRRARVLVVGAGGLGSPVLAYLGAAGVGTIGVADDDRVEISNLQRQVVHTESAVGTPKVTSAAAFVTGLNSGVAVIEHEMRVDAETALDLVSEYDVVVDGSDTFTTRYVLNDACVALGVPLVWASIAQYAGQLGVVDPGRGPCYRCLFPHPLDDDAVPSCAIGGVLGVLPGVMGSLQASETIKIITGVGEPLTHGVLLYDALATTFSRLPLARHEQCSACALGYLFVGLDAGLDANPSRDSGAPQVPSLDATAVRELTSPCVVDVREADECLRRPLPPSLTRGGRHVHVALSTWDTATPGHLANLAAGSPIVMVCAAGRRSQLAAARVLEADAGAAVSSLAGGLDAYDEMGDAG